MRYSTLPSGRDCIECAHAQGRPDTARHIIGYRLTYETRIYITSNEVAEVHV